MATRRKPPSTPRRRGARRTRSGASAAPPRPTTEAAGAARGRASRGKLAEYRRKRDPARTSEPFDRGGGDGFFVVQKHAATRLHYDVRLAMGGVLVSWAVPKGPSYDPKERRLAVHVEDHPLSYRDFEGTIPKGEYGAGSVIVWDTGPFRLREGSVERGSLKLDLEGRKLRGGWALVRMKPRDDKDEWLLIKEKDEHADPDRDVTAEEPESVVSGLTVEEVGERKDARQWNSRVLRALEGLPERSSREGPPPPAEFMKARLADDVPRGEGWVYEIKLDGVRVLAIRRGGEVRLVTRNQKEVAFRYPEVAAALEALPGGDFVMDGEIVAFDAEGHTRFELLQGRIHLSGAADIRAASEATPTFFYAFDLLYAEGRRLEDAPLLERKAVLALWLEQGPRRIRLSDHVLGRGPEFLRLACEKGLEGVIAKRADAPYRPTRSGEWVKVKCLNRQEFVVGGWTPPRGGRAHFGSLLLGVHEDGRLRYAGKVGTGFTGKTLADVHRRLERLERATPPFEDPPRERGARWVRPELVAEVRYTEWTSDGKLRHPAFLGLRTDKPAGQVVRETPGRARRDVPERAVDRAREAPKAASPPKRAAPRTAAAGRAPSPRPRRSTAAKPKSDDADVSPAGRSGRSPTAASSRGGRGGAAARRSRPASDREVPVTNPQKVLYPTSGVTKGEVVEYYRGVADTILPYLRDRPLTLVRFPNGLGGPSFFQKDQPDSLPEWIPTVRVRSQEGRKDVDYLLCNDRPALVYVANLGTLDLHPWASRVPDLERPDYVVWDLDPPEGGYAKAAAMAPRVREVLQSAGLVPFLKTSGGKGLHLYVPLRPEHDHDAVRSFAELVATLVVEAHPRTTTLERSKRARGGKVYVDYLQNGRGKTVVAPYSLRAKEPATVSTPIDWEELAAGAEPRDFTIRTVPERLRTRGDAWKGFGRRPASLEAALARLQGGSRRGARKAPSRRKAAP